MLIGYTGSSEEAHLILKARMKQVADGIDLFEGVKIRLVSKEDIEVFKSSSLMTSFLPSYMSISRNMFVLEKHLTIKDVPDLQVNKTLRNIILAMRLFKKGYVSFNGIFYILISEKPQIMATSFEETQIHPDIPPLERYVLSFDAIPQFQKVVGKIVKKIHSLDLDKRKGLRLACKRFQHAYEERDAENRLIDFMIALEALFLKGEKTRQVGPIVSTTCSVLLGKNELEREKIRSSLTKAYNLRNRIVHGAEYDKLFKEKNDMLPFISEIENYLRESIKKLLN